MIKIIILWLKAIIKWIIFPDAPDQKWGVPNDRIGKGYKMGGNIKNHFYLRIFAKHFDIFSKFRQEKKIDTKLLFYGSWFCWFFLSPAKLRTQYCQKTFTVKFYLFICFALWPTFNLVCFAQPNITVICFALLAYTYEGGGVWCLNPSISFFTFQSKRKALREKNTLIAISIHGQGQGIQKLQNTNILGVKNLSERNEWIKL